MTTYVIYSRKSLEDDDSQIQSIPDQEREMNSLASKLNFTVLESLSEARSAKAPGRPVFDDMMNGVERGDIRGILCWKLDRLARNPVDGGRIIWAIKQHGLVVRTPHQTFSQAEDNLILMYIEFGMAQKYVDDLSRNTMRGLKSKAQKGWFPGVAPMGYLNSKSEERGHKTILRDPHRFDAVRRMWDLILTGNFNPAQIQKIANEKWGFRTRQTKRTGGKPLSRSTVYKIFSDPFYYGQFEYPAGSGEWYTGAHEPMVTEAEFQCVQKILHQRTNPRPKKELALLFRGLMKCGQCGSSITAHLKEQVRCTRCRYKSSVKNFDSCSKCRLPVSEMKTPQRRRYAYYHCTRTLNPLCRQKGISSTVLETQVASKLPCFGLSAELSKWGLKYIDKLCDEERNGRKRVLEERKKAYDQCMARIENLVKLQTAPENADGSLLSAAEYQQQRAALLLEKGKLANGVTTFETELEAKRDRLKGTLELVAGITVTDLDDDSVRQKELLSALGLNHELKEKELTITPEFPFSELPRGGSNVPSNLNPIEPDSSQEKPSWNADFDTRNPRLERDSDEDRTKMLKRGLESIWRNMDLSLPIFKRYPFTNEMSVYRPRRRRGRFISPRDSE